MNDTKNILSLFIVFLMGITIFSCKSSSQPTHTNVNYELESGIDSDNDGVPDYRDKSPNTLLGSYVNYWGEPIPLDMIGKIPSVFFEFNKYELDDKSKDIIKGIAAKMAKNRKLKLEIRGYADNVGSQQYNIKLSGLRALETKKELVETYDIGSARIIANGMGKIPQPASSYPLNRRCDFFFDQEVK